MFVLCKTEIDGVIEKFADKPGNISAKTARRLPHTDIRWLPPCAEYKKEAEKVAHFSYGAVAGHTAFHRMCSCSKYDL